MWPLLKEASSMRNEAGEGRVTATAMITNELRPQNKSAILLLSAHFPSSTSSSSFHTSPQPSPTPFCSPFSTSQGP